MAFRPEQLPPKARSGARRSRKYAKRQTARYRRRQGKLRLDDAPKRNRYLGYWD